MSPAIHSQLVLFCPRNIMQCHIPPPYCTMFNVYDNCLSNVQAGRDGPLWALLGRDGPCPYLMHNDDLEHISNQ